MSAPAAAPAASRDPIGVEIIKNAMATLAEEMGVTVVRSAYSSWIKESADASTAVLNARAELIAQSGGTFLAHLASLRASLPELLLDFPAASMRPGDLYLMNDPARGGIHANDIEVFRPVFAGGRVAFFTAALVHVADIGAVTAGGLPAEATDIFHEGLLLPPVALYRAGVPNDDIMRVIRLNSRTPDMVAGDIHALVAACNVGAERLAALIDRWTLPVLEQVLDDVLDYTEDRTRRQIARLAEGRFEGSFTIDDDGIDLGRSYQVRVAAQRRGTDLVLDLTGTDPQARGAINASRSQATSGVVYAARCFLDPTLPMNEGMLRPLDIVLPPGSLVAPGPTAALNARIVTIFAIVDALSEALSQQDSVRGAASAGLVHLFTASGIAPDGRTWVDMFSEYGGLGASGVNDGLDADGAYLFAGRAMTQQVEGKEADNPAVVCERYALVPDSGGAGRHRGGLGVEVAYRFRTDVEISVRTDRVRLPPPGREGGAPGGPGHWVVNPGRPDERVLRSKEMGVTLRRGDVLVMRTSGGGGYGPPWERPVERVVADVTARRVSRPGAAEAYGVVLRDGSLEVDHAATTAARAALRDTAGAVR